MDLRCFNCGEPWDMHYVFHDAEPCAFVTNGAVITHCPCCKANGQATGELKTKLDDQAHVLSLFGDDIDGAAAFLDDMDYA